MITGWLTRLVVVLAVLAVFAFDGFSVVAAHLKASDDAQAVAQAGADAYKQSASPAAALLASQQAIPKGDTLVANSFQINPNGEVSVKIKRTASTLLLHLSKQTKHWADVTETGSADPPS